jgi:hypothetical protein
MENVLVISLDCGRLYPGPRSLICDSRCIFDGSGHSGYGSQNGHNANAHEHPDGQEASKENIDAQEQRGHQNQWHREHNENRQEIPSSQHLKETCRNRKISAHDDVYARRVAPGARGGEDADERYHPENAG